MYEAETLEQDERDRKLSEIHDRCRRIETNLHKIREGLNIDLPDAKAQVVTIDANTVQVQGYDITIAKIKRALETANLFIPGHQVDIVLPVDEQGNECRIAEIKIYN
jgi:multidrug efflux pump subunit AcrB